MLSLIRYGTLSALCLLISTISAKAGLFPVAPQSQAACVPGDAQADMFAVHDASVHGVHAGAFYLAAPPALLTPVSTSTSRSLAEFSPAPTWLADHSYKRAGQFDLRS